MKQNTSLSDKNENLNVFLHVSGIIIFSKEDNCRGSLNNNNDTHTSPPLFFFWIYPLNFNITSDTNR